MQINGYKVKYVQKWKINIFVVGTFIKKSVIIEILCYLLLIAACFFSNILRKKYINNFVKMSHNYQIIVPRIRVGMLPGRIRMWWPILMRLWRRVAKMICRMMMIILRRKNLLLRRHRWSPNVSMRKYFHYPR